MYSFFFSSRRRHTRWPRDWSSDVCSSDLVQDRDGAVGVVVHGHSALAWMGAQQPAGVLHQLSLERHREGKEQRVELGAVEALAQVLSGCDHDQVLVRRGGLDGGQESVAGLLGKSTLEHDRLRAGVL